MASEKTRALRAIESCRARWLSAPTHVKSPGRKNRHKHNAKRTLGNVGKFFHPDGRPRT